MVRNQPGGPLAIERKARPCVDIDNDRLAAGLDDGVSAKDFEPERGCGAKLHVVLDPHAVLPVHFVVTPRRVNDITPAKALVIEPGATYVFDLGYYDFA